MILENTTKCLDNLKKYVEEERVLSRSEILGLIIETQQCFGQDIENLKKSLNEITE